MDADRWLVFLSAAALVAASPGANNFLALAHGMRRGFAPAVTALAGRCAAFALMILAVCTGLGAILAASEAAFQVIKWVGVGYLAWLGLGLWRAEPAAETAGAGASSDGGSSLIGREFWVALTNPKAILLFTAFVPQFVDPAGPWATQLLTYAAAYVAVELVAATGYAFVGSRIKGLRLGPRGARRVDRVSGGMMLAAAGWLALARRGG